MCWISGKGVLPRSSFCQGVCGFSGGKSVPSSRAIPRTGPKKRLGAVVVEAGKGLLPRSSFCPTRASARGCSDSLEAAVCYLHARIREQALIQRRLGAVVAEGLEGVEGVVEVLDLESFVSVSFLRGAAGVHWTVQHNSSDVSLFHSVGVGVWH